MSFACLEIPEPGTLNIQIIKALNEFDLLLKGVRETIQNEAKEQIRGFFSMLLGTLGASFLGNM